MKKNKNTSVLFVVSFLFLLVGSIILSSCESSRVGPQLPTPNPPAPPAQPLVLKGTVVDSKTGGAVSGATVQVLKQDGSAVTTLATDATGAFSYDITTLNQAVLKVTATASGFGFAFVYATIDLVNKAAQIVAIPLDKIQTTAIILTPSGGSVTVPSNESVSGQGVTITVPANAVTQNTTVTASQVNINNVPPPTNSATTTQVGVTNLQPAGITFAQPVTLSFPLPYQFNPGEQIPIQEFVNGSWVSTSLNATVDNTGLIANVNVTRTSQYALVDNTVVSGTSSGSIIPNDNNSTTFSLSKVLDTRQYTFSSGTLNITDLTGSMVWTVTKTKKGTTNLPGDSWLLNLFRQRFGTNPFTGWTSVNSTTTTFPIQFTVPWPDAHAPKAATSDGGGNVDYPGQSGSWSIRVTVSTFSNTTFNVTFENAKWKITTTTVKNSWQITLKEWIWTGHNQGAVSYPF